VVDVAPHYRTAGACFTYPPADTATVRLSPISWHQPMTHVLSPHRRHHPYCISGLVIGTISFSKQKGAVTPLALVSK
jgi:hypothetical protein